MAGPTYWRAADPKPAYDIVIVGGGGHGLSTAYYLAKNHGITNVCVVEKGWLAGGNMARNTTVIRSNYLWDESSAIYEHSLKLWEGLEQDLGSELHFSQRGVLNLAHSLGDVRSSIRRLHANRLNGIDAEWLEPEDVKAFCPIINTATGIDAQAGDGIARQIDLTRIAEGLQARTEEIASVISQEVGMPLTLSGLVQVGLPVTVACSANRSTCRTAAPRSPRLR